MAVELDIPRQETLFSEVNHELIYEAKIPSSDPERPIEIAKFYLNRRPRKTENGTEIPVGIEIELFDPDNKNVWNQRGETEIEIRSQIVRGIKKATEELGTFTRNRWANILENPMNEISLEEQEINNQILEFSGHKDIHKIDANSVEINYLPVCVTLKTNKPLSAPEVLIGKTDWGFIFIPDKTDTNPNKRNPLFAKGKLFKTSHKIQDTDSQYISTNPINLWVVTQKTPTYLHSDQVDKSELKFRSIWETRISTDRNKIHSMEVGKISLYTPDGESKQENFDQKIGLLIELNQIQGIEDIWEKVICGRDEEILELQNHILWGLQHASRRIETFGNLYWDKHKRLFTCLKPGKANLKFFTLNYLPVIVDFNSSPFSFCPYPYTLQQILEFLTYKEYYFEEDKNIGFVERGTVFEGSQHSIIKGRLHPYNKLF